MAVQKNIVIIQELRKQFKDMDDSFLAPIQSYDDKVNNDVINFTEIGADPNVLIDNTTYPIVVNTRTDVGLPVSLHKLDTENTKITDDELFALAYDKKSSVRKQHMEALMRANLKLGAHSLAPSADNANTPVIQTTGATVGHRKKLLVADLVTYKRLIDALEIPLESRYLVLCSDHVNDLIETDQAFRDRYYNTENGKLIKNIYGFGIWESLHTPKYVGTTYAKKAFGSAAAATDISSSVFYSNLNNMKALGSTGIYYRDAQLDPENRMSVFGARQYAIVSPVTTKGAGAITDGYVA
jgi:hypothetical protein